MIIRRFNLPLILGLLCVGVLVVVALFTGAIAPRDPLERNYLIEVTPGEFKSPPMNPGEAADFPLGTDFEGRDTLSRLLWSIRPTLALTLIVSLLRLGIGTLLGFAEGWNRGIVSDAVASIRRVAQSVPMIFLAIIVIYVLGFRFEAWVFIIALTLTGWASTANTVAERTRIVKEQAFIEASRALGARDSRLLWKHVLPQVRTLLIVTWAFEMSAVLLQLAELGFLGFFFGGGELRLIPEPDTPAFRSEIIAGMPELGQMLSAGWDNFFLAPWLSVISGSAFFYAIFSFMLLGEGLKRYFSQHENAMIGSPFRAVTSAFRRMSSVPEPASQAVSDFAGR